MAVKYSSMTPQEGSVAMRRLRERAISSKPSSPVEHGGRETKHMVPEYLATAQHHDAFRDYASPLVARFQ